MVSLELEDEESRSRTYRRLTPRAKPSFLTPIRTTDIGQLCHATVANRQPWYARMYVRIIRVSLVVVATGREMKE